MESKNKELETTNKNILNDFNSMNLEKDNVLLEFQNAQEDLEKYFFEISEINKLKDSQINEIQRAQLILGRLLKHSNQLKIKGYLFDKKKKFNLNKFLPFKKLKS